MAKNRPSKEHEKLSIEDIIKAVLANPQQAAQLDRDIAQRADTHLIYRFLDSVRHNYHPGDIIKFRKAVGTTPEVNRDLRKRTQESCCSLMEKKLKSLGEGGAFSNDLYSLWGQISAVEEVTSVKPCYTGRLRELVQEVYNTLLMKGNHSDLCERVDNFIGLEKAIGVKPELSKKTVEKVQRDIADYFIIKMINPIFTASWDAPLMVLPGILRVPFEETAADIKKYLPNTGAKLVLTKNQKDKVARAQRELIRHCYSAPCVLIRDMTSIGVNPEFVQETYLGLIADVGAGRTHENSLRMNIQNLQADTGIKPIKDEKYKAEVQKAYLKLLREETLLDHLIARHKQLETIFEVPILKDQEYLEAVQDRYIHIIEGYWMLVENYWLSPKEVEEFRGWVGIDPKIDDRFKKAVKKAYLRRREYGCDALNYPFYSYVKKQFGVIIEFDDEEQKQIQDSYKSLLEFNTFHPENPKTVEIRLKDIEGMIRCTGIQPNFSKDQQAKYNRMKQKASLDLGALTSGDIRS